MGNGSLDFLNMIRNGADATPVPKTREQAGKRDTGSSVRIEKSETVEKKESSKVTAKTASVEKAIREPKAVNRDQGGMLAVIDTETNWHDEVMSVGVAIADAISFKCVSQRYYIFDPECRVGGYYSNALYKGSVKADMCRRDEAMSDLGEYLMASGVTRIFAYNAKFDFSHLPELGGFEWFDIMRLAAYRQFNPAIPAELPCCKTGRLKTNYGVEPIMRLLSGNSRYFETHNAVQDALDELKIVELLGHGIEAYECGRIN